jgi:hypothetical protein
MTAANPEVLQKVQEFLDGRKLGYEAVEEKYCTKLVVKVGPHRRPCQRLQLGQDCCRR